MVSDEECYLWDAQSTTNPPLWWVLGRYQLAPCGQILVLYFKEEVGQTVRETTQKPTQTGKSYLGEKILNNQFSVFIMDRASITKVNSGKKHPETLCKAGTSSAGAGCLRALQSSHHQGQEPALPQEPSSRSWSWPGAQGALPPPCLQCCTSKDRRDWNPSWQFRLRVNNGFVLSG